MKFARNLASSRLDIARRLTGTYPAITVFTPMLVDMAYGVYDNPSTTVEEQIDLHSMISELSIMGGLADRDVLFLPFVGFDPRREQRIPGSLDIVKRAIESQGFVGIKMYPPMGFSPIHNEEPQLDSILDDLYQWCESRDVPITVHCNRSQGAVVRANDERSDPQAWGEVLEKYPSIHLNLGHFGGVNHVRAKPFWPLEIARLSRFDHVYADLGCHTDLLESSGVAKYVKMLEKVLSGAGAEMRNRLMYGSDWSMLLEHPGCEDYVAAVSSVFPESEYEQLFGGRALEFLGLGAAPNSNGDRILRRIRDLGADPATWFAGIC